MSTNNACLASLLSVLHHTSQMNESISVLDGKCLDSIGSPYHATRVSHNISLYIITHTHTHTTPTTIYMEHS